MRIIFKLISAVVLTIASVDSAFAVTNAIPCNYSAITNALATAHEGDTVLIGPGSCVMSNSAYGYGCRINRNISFTIAGSGTNATTLIAGPGVHTAISIESNSKNVFTVRDLNLVCNPAVQMAGFLYAGSTAQDSPGLYHFYNIQMTNISGRGLTIGQGKAHNSYGLIDHCYLVAGANYLQCLDFEGADYGAWTNANPLGTINVDCVEDCHLVTDPSNNGGNGFFDAYVGAQVLFRHNFCDGYSPIGGHGYDSQPTSIRTWEIYNNVFTNMQGGNGVMFWRGGTGIVYSNAAYGNPNQMATLIYYRAEPTNWPTGQGPPGYLRWGQPGKGYIINYQGVQAQNGVDTCITNNPVDGQQLCLGETHYYYVSALSHATFNMANNNGYGGGAILIGATVAQTITNTFRAVNAVPGYYGVSYTNWGGLPMLLGHEQIAIGMDANNLYLTNALDTNTNQFGYPANQQPGVVQSYPLTSTNFINYQTKFPCYGWGNTINGVLSPAFTINPVGQYYITNLILLNRDYFNDVIPGTNIYKPLVYPHPLQALEGAGGSTSSLTPPAGLIVISGS